MSFAGVGGAGGSPERDANAERATGPSTAPAMASVMVRPIADAAVSARFGCDVGTMADPACVASLAADVCPVACPGVEFSLGVCSSAVIGSGCCDVETVAANAVGLCLSCRRWTMEAYADPTRMHRTSSPFGNLRCARGPEVK